MYFREEEKVIFWLDNCIELIWFENRESFLEEGGWVRFIRGEVGGFCKL